MRCPGQDTRYLKPDDIFEVNCGQCGYSIEFFKDDASRRCPNCGSRIVNPKISMGCAQWCKHAKECLGFDPQNQQREQRSEASLADRLVDAMKNEFGDDQRRSPCELDE